MFNSPNKSIGVIKGLESAPGKNILINGNLRVDQREKSQFGHALPTDEFVYDRWMLVANGRPEIYQIIEDGNYEPNTQYTLSWEGGATKTVTSPASGHWNMKDSFAVSELPSWSSKKIQLEKGDTATDFELEDVGTTLLKCQRYYSGRITIALEFYGITSVSFVHNFLTSVPLRNGSPTIDQDYDVESNCSGTDVSVLHADKIPQQSILVKTNISSTGYCRINGYAIFDAEIPA